MRIKIVQRDNLRGMLGTRIDRMGNLRIRNSCSVRKGVIMVVIENILR